MSNEDFFSSFKDIDISNLDLGKLFSDEGGERDFELPEGLMSIADAAAEQLMQHSKHMMENAVGYKELMMMYSCAIKEVTTKFEVLNAEFNNRYQRNPIKFINSRLKHSRSIAEKLARRGMPVTLENIENELNDIAGIRVICSYIDDIYQIADALTQQDDVKLISRKDYIESPKPNGYRSLHLIISVPVFFATQKREMRVEVQIRTIAMDFWASLEHQMRYKQNIPNVDDINRQLTGCAQAISAIDQKMQDIRLQIEAYSGEPSDEEILLEKLSKMDISID